MSNIVVEPAAAQFTAEGGTAAVQVCNAGEARAAVKVKCSDNNLFKVSVVYAFVDAGQALPLEIQRVAGPGKEDRIVVQHAPAGEAQEPKECFPPGGAFPEVSVTLSCVWALVRFSVKKRLFVVNRSKSYILYIFVILR